MNKNLVKVIGIVGSVIGTIVGIFGWYKYHGAKTMFNAASAAELFSGGDPKASDIWEGYMGNYRIVLIIGLVILTVSIILLISGIISGSANTFVTDGSSKVDKNDINIEEKLTEINNLLEKNLITNDEYETKKQEILNKI